MPGILSKVLGDQWAVCFNCYEVGHVWNPSCTEAALDLGLVAFMEAFKLYTPLYLLAQVALARRYDHQTFIETAKSILRSSAFIGSNALTLLLFFCGMRNLTGKFYYRLQAYIPTFVGALFSILIEKPSRRGPLAIYVANIASECLFRIYVDRGYIKPIPRGEVLLFSVTMSVLLYLIKKQGYSSDPVSLVLKYYLGREEAKMRVKKVTKVSTIDSAIDEKENRVLLHNNEPEPNQLKHVSCPHNGSCLSYATHGFVKPLVATWLGHSLLYVLKRYKQVLKEPSFMGRALFESKSIKFGLFFGSFSAIYKAVNCFLRWRCDGSRDWHSLVGGLVAGPSMLLYPNSTITLYLFWKCVETVYCNGVKRGHFKSPLMTANLVYAISVSQIAFCVLLEPKHMRPSYMKFIDQVSGHRFHEINRFALNLIVPDAVAGYEEYFPDLDPAFMSNKFMESVFQWLL